MDHLSCVIGITFLLFSVQLHSVQGVLVPCTHREEVCECQTTASDCTFKLDIQQLITFTSYPLDSNGYLRDAPGTSYSVSDRGFTATRSSDCRPSNCCFTNPGITDSFFIDNDCSVPMTVDGDSGTPRKFIAVNGRIPGPTIIVKENQIVKVTVNNRITCSSSLHNTTIHWHGMHQVNTEWMDGVGSITQRDIYCGNTFDYIFKAKPAGTHWYHSHSGIQRTEGLFGSLIVLEKTNFFSQTVVPQINRVSTELNIGITDMPSQHTLTLLDWYREYNKPDSVKNMPVTYHSGLINGRGRLHTSTVTPLSVFNVVSGMDYRFRVIGAQNHFAYRLSIENHDLHVIATDGNGNGVFITPITVDYLVVHSGERYDFIPKRRTSQDTKFSIIAQKIDINDGMQMTNLTEMPAEALLRYDADNAFLWTDPQNIRNNHTCRGNPCEMLNCLTNLTENSENCIPWTELRPLRTSRNDLLPDITNFINSNNPSVLFNFAFEGPGELASVNEKSFENPNDPYLCQQYDMDKKESSDTFCSNNSPDSSKCIHVYEIESTNPNGQVMIFTALRTKGGRTAHPIHLHGHSFYILDVGFDATSRYPCQGEGDNSCRPLPTSQRDTVVGTYNTNRRIKDNYILKDTLVVPGGGYVVIAFQANNPGYWFLHCHIEKHLSDGMALIVEAYPYTEHTSPPEGISDANFTWDIPAYKRFVDQAAKCGGRDNNGSRRGEVTFLLIALLTIFLAL